MGSSGRQSSWIFSIGNVSSASFTSPNLYLHGSQTRLRFPFSFCKKAIANEAFLGCLLTPNCISMITAYPGVICTR